MAARLRTRQWWLASNHVMRGPLRLLGHSLCLLALLASVAAFVLWVRSYRVGETWHFKPASAPPADAAPLPGKPDTWVYQYHLACGDGQLQVVRRNMATSDVKQLGYRSVDPPEKALTHLIPGGNAGGSGWRFAGFEYFRSSRRYVSTGAMTAWIWGFLVVGVPLWLLTVLLAVPPVAWLIRHRSARRRKRAGLCPGCGYDLRASREFGRCPECGRATVTPQAPAADAQEQRDVPSPGPTPSS
jgi:hypothetical protein